ncbi:MAG: hypothetical protein NVSMB64_20210 [Candidatus Velthaea sp.]
MKPTTWQRLVIVGIAIAFVHIVLDLVGSFYTGGQGFTATLVDAGDTSRYRVTAIEHPEQTRPRLRVGDVLRLAQPTLSERLRYRNSRTGDRFTYIRQDGSRVTNTIAYAPPTALEYVFALIRLSMIGMALLIALRRHDFTETRTLATFLLLFGFAISQQPQPFLPDRATLAFIYVQQLAILGALAQAVRLATVFPDPNAGGFRAVLRRINPYVTFIFAVATVMALTLNLTNDGRLPAALRLVSYVSTAYYLLAVTIAFTIANRQAAGADRQRVAWVSYSLAVGFSGAIVQIGFVFANHFSWWTQLFALTLIAIPLGLGYAMVRHRVIDIGFVVNRAIAWTALSALVVTSFALLEWFLGKYLVEISHTTSASIEVGVALVLGASLRQIHARVEKIADDIFFRDRNRAEAALKRFALDAQYITDLRTIFDRTIVEVRTHAEARDAAMYLIDGAHFTRTAGGPGFAEIIDENDPAFVRMRATRETCDLHDLRSAIEGDIAFPFIVRGAVSGALVCCAKSNGEAYAPDERAVLAEVARSVGIASDTLYTEALRREIERVLGTRPSLGSARDLLRPATGGVESAF